ncbi:phosphatase PAP2 family protein [Pedobacter sp. SD-b]|uniref:Phosphatase PAP2 family protein n=1 Tax=Pedobacter segetis TaxID=2793069 RepID=A0ABS1BG07_9SPHI|nr:phosphatase PAP2 family protein [Pedobacter segetis]MBK0381794.1 phosphatase PAP2 family protein [Pedobacter segetis]
MLKLGNKNARRILLIIISGFLILTILVWVFPSSWIDHEFSEEVQEYHNSVLDFIMKAISWFGLTYQSVISVVLSAAILYIAKKRKTAYFCLATLLVALITYLIKVLVNRPRPGKDLVRVIIEVQHQSFPSGHVSFYIAFFGFIAFILYHHKWLNHTLRSIIICFCMFLILTIPISRIYLGAHWFSDVLGGFLLGTAYLWILILIYLRVIKRDSLNKVKRS